MFTLKSHAQTQGRSPIWSLRLKACTVLLLDVHLQLRQTMKKVVIKKIFSIKCIHDVQKLYHNLIESRTEGQMQKEFVYVILNLCIDAEECVCMHAYSLLAFSLLRDGFQRMQERCSSRQKSLTNPLDPAFSFTICVPDCITLMHRSTANNADTQTQTRLAENHIKTKKGTGVWL